MANSLCRDPYRTLMYERGDSRLKVTLARVFGVEEGVTYITVPFTLKRGGEGEHMRRKVVDRRWL